MHVGIIMDGNGRWAANLGMPRVFGHRRGASRVSEIVRISPKLGIKTLTLYAFSTENWNRAAHEVESLMRIFRGYLQSKFLSLVENNVCVKFLGDPSPISNDIIIQMKQLEAATKNNNGLYLNIAVNYGGRDEIVRAVKKVVNASKAGTLKISDLNEETFSSFLDTRNQSDPELIIRTAGELRLSNFLTWQSSYSEFYFTNKNWPEFYLKDFKNALIDYNSRQRKFGKEMPSVLSIK